MISRKAHGLPDEEANGRLGFLDFRKLNTYSQVDLAVNSNASIKDVPLVNQLDTKCSDSEPDEFYFEINGYTGKFAFDWVDNVSTATALYPKISSSAPVLVKGTRDAITRKITQWDITAPDGTLYTFANTEQTTSIGTQICENQGDLTYISSWYLTQITNSNEPANSIVLQYDGYTLVDKGISNSQTTTQRLPDDPISSSNALVGIVKTQNTRSSIVGLRLKKIIAQPQNISIDFKAITDRTDIDYDILNANNKRLDSIIVNGVGEVAQKYALQYEYQGSRLTLRKVIQSAGALTLPPYEFQYNTTVLPTSKQSTSVDHWGYYNGQSNSNFIPLKEVPLTSSWLNGSITAPYLNCDADGRIIDVLSNTVITYIDNVVMRGSANREPDINFSKAQILEKVIYPTGGISELIYEGHDYTYIQNTNLSSKGLYAKLNKTESITVSNMSVGASDGTYFTVSKLITPNQAVGTVTINISAIFGTCPIDVIKPRKAFATLYKQISNVWVPIYTQVFTTSSSKTIRKQIISGQNYKIEVKVTDYADNASECVRSSMDMYWDENNLSIPIIQKIAGGVRIKTINTYKDASDLNPIVKQYEYKQDNSTLSSGVLNGEPVYETNKQLFKSYTSTFSPYMVTQVGLPVNVLSGSNALMFGNSSGSHIGYRRVTVSQLNGKTVKEFTSQFDYPDVVHFVPPFGEATSNGHKTGLIKIETTYSTGGSIVASKKYGYFFSEFDITPIRVSVITDCASGGSWPPPANPQYIGCDQLTVLQKYANSNASTTDKGAMRFGYSQIKSDTTFQDNVTTVTSYTYDANLQLKKTETKTNSDNKVYSTRMYYATELSNNMLILKNMVGIPLKVESSVDGSLKKISTVDYDLFNTTQVLPKYIKEYNRDNVTTTTRLYVQSYNTSGLPLSATINNALVPETYTWTATMLLWTKNFGGLTWAYAYRPNSRLIQAITDENGLITKYTFDDLMRLNKSENRFSGTIAAPLNVQATTLYDYHYKLNASDNNYVGTSTTFINATNSTPLSTKQYLDGLGRSMGTVRETYTPSLLHQKNNVTYDALGRQDKTYLPFESGSLGFEAAGGTVPYAFTTYEASPLSRALKQTNVDGTGMTLYYGANTILDSVRKFNFTPAQGAPGTVLYSALNFAANDLYKTCSWNENGTNILPATLPVVFPATTVGRTEMYKDKLGRTILTRKFLGNQKVDTYNIYDDYGNLVMVIPPGGLDASGNPIATLVFTYTYDNLSRLSEKKIPNADLQKFFYDDRDLLTLTQDGNMRTTAFGGNTNKYLGTEYNNIGQVVKTGWVTTLNPLSTALAVTIPNDTNKLTEIQYYTNRTWVKHQAAKVLKPWGVSTLREYMWSYIERRVGYEYTGNPIWTGKQHLLSKTYVNGSTLVNADGPITDNDYGGVDWSVSAYNGLQKPTATSRNLYCDINAGSSARTVRTHENYTFDNAQRLTNLDYGYKIGGSAVTQSDLFNMSKMTYNYKDQVTDKNTALVAGKYLQSVDFDYNVRGWLKNINSGFQQTANDYPLFSCSGWEDYYAYGSGTYPSNMPFTPAAQSGEDNADLFKEVIRYDDPNYLIPGAGVSQRNGNISQIEWQVAGKEAQGYSFKYDDLDRLTEANYVDIHSYNYSSHGWTQQYKTDNKYQEKVSYDLRGNITALERNGLTSNCQTYNGFVAGLWGKIDNLTYTYDPADLNKLTKVTDASDLTRGFKSVNNNSTYTYDANGNLTSDLNKNITGITYNYLNLPLVISFTGNNRIEFIYDATGAKLRKTTYANNTLQETRDYVNGVEYKNGVVDRFAHTEGAVVRQADGTTFSHEYTIKDHLGNARVTYSDGNNDGIITVADIKQINSYYPFGMNMEGNWNGAAGSNKYAYNSKEWNDDFGLGLNDYGARFYDPAIGRWGAVDPLASMYAAFSPYNFTMNNPIKFIDPNGMAVVEMSGKTIFTGQDAKDAFKVIKSRYANKGELPKGIYLNSVGDIIQNTTAKGNNNPNVYIMNNGTPILLGQIGGTINIDAIYRNLLEQNVAIARGMYNPYTFRDFVTAGGRWDYKIRYNQPGRANTIFGYVHTIRKDDTNFSFFGEIMQSQDIGNHHFGVVGKACGFPFSENIMQRQAGAAQMRDGTSDPAWQKYEVVHTPQGDLQGAMLFPYGDDPRDQRWMIAGFNYYKNWEHRP